MNLIHLLPLIARFRVAMLALGQAVASRDCWRVDARLGYWAAPGVVRREVVRFAYHRISRVRALLEALVGRMQAGTLRVGRQRARPGGSGEGRVAASREQPDMGAITRQFGWLCPLVQSEAACYAQHLRDILVEPEMQRLLAEVPQATRILKPVLHMLGIRLDRLALEATPQLVAAPAVAAADLADRFWAYEPGFLDLYRGAGVVRRENG